MNTRILLVGALCANLIASLYSHSNREHCDGVIANASYCIYEGASDIVGGIGSSSKYVTFYTYNGNHITKIEHHDEFSKINNMLDHNAPKPQPITCTIKYWPAIPMPFGGTKGVPGWFICFYDKHGNQIDCYRYDEKKHEINVLLFSKRQNTYKRQSTFRFDQSNPSLIDKSFPLDLSNTSAAQLIPR